MNWHPLAQELAAKAAHPRSRWFPAVAGTPRHLLAPAWFYRDDETGQWQAWDGSGEDRQEWLRATFANKTRITRIGPLHAEQARPGDHPAGMPTSSATQPGLVVQMLRLGYLRHGDAICDLGTGTGYSAALLCHRFGADNVTSIDVDPYLTKAATERLGLLGHHPAVHTMDAAQALPGTFDAIVAMFSVRPCPPSWLAALRPGGRMVFAIAGTTLVVCADKRPGGGASGLVDAYTAGFMEARHGADYEAAAPCPEEQADAERRPGRYPVVDIDESWDLRSAFGLAAPGVRASFTSRDGIRSLSLWDSDGSWAAGSGHATEAADVRQGGPRRLWDELEAVLDQWVPSWTFPWYRATVEIDPDGTIHLAATSGRQCTVGREDA